MNTKLLLLVILLDSALNQNVEAHNILVIFPAPIKSHLIVFDLLLTRLQEHGHFVTLISHFVPSTMGPNLTHVNLQGSVHQLRDIVSLDKSQSWFRRYQSPLLLSNLAHDACRHGLASEAFQKFLTTVKVNRAPEYDLVLAEFFNTDCFLGIMHWIRAPLIVLSTCAPLPWTNAQVGNPDNPAVNSVVYLDLMNTNSFFERLENTLVWVSARLFYNFVNAQDANDYARKFIDDSIADVGILAENSSILLVNTHFTLTGARAMIPGVIEVGGIHIGLIRKLPSNIEKWINESTDGVIYFSMGSMIKGHTLSEAKRKLFLKVFSRFKQRVLWKWENETMPEKPDYVMIQKWMPQFDILCNPNVKAFISHGGLLGITEAVHCGVPVIVLPQFGDQHTNGRAVESGGGGIVLNFQEADEEMVYNALRTVMEPAFNKKTKELSARFRDRPMSPMDTAIYWIEYVVRHKGAHHMRTAAVGMPLYQYLLLDVVGFLVFLTLCTFLIGAFVVKYIIRMMKVILSFKVGHVEKQKKN